MATITKSRARKPLADGTIAYSWSNMDNGERYNFGVSSSEHFYRLSVTPKEAINMIAYLAGDMTTPKTGYVYDKRTTVQKLRDLADKLEQE